MVLKAVTIPVTDLMSWASVPATDTINNMTKTRRVLFVFMALVYKANIIRIRLANALTDK